MSAAVPGIPRVNRAAKVAVALVAAALVGSACAPQGSPPNIPVQFGVTGFLTQVVDQVYDVGRSPSVALDKGGQPAVSYLLLRPRLKKGAIPPPLLANTPQPPSVVLASEAAGIWSRQNVTPNAAGGGKGTAVQIADKDGYYDGQSTAAIAVDAKGFHHVAWSTPGGLYYATDASVDLPGGKTALVFGAEPTQVASTPAAGCSIAVDAGGKPWIAFYAGGQVHVATVDGSSWSVQDVDRAPANTQGVRTAVAATPGGPLVAYQGTAGPMIAAPAGGPLGLSGATATGWAKEPLGSVHGTVLGMSMTLSLSGDPSQNGQPVVSFVGAGGDVQVAARAGDGSWKMASPGKVGTVPTGDDATAVTTGLAVDANGNQWVAWPDLDAGNIMVGEAAAGGGPFNASAIPESAGGWSPSLAVSSDGKHVAVAWYDSVNHHLNVATRVQGRPLLAVPSPLFSPLPTPVASGQLPCFPTAGTNLTIEAPAGAAGTGFSTKCLAVLPGRAFTVAFTNADTQAIHNFAIYTDSTATKLLGGAPSATDTVPTGGSTTYQVSALDPGTYFFRCDVHPTTMTGTFVVTNKKAPAGSPSPTPSASASA
jgi:plastocyanin